MFPDLNITLGEIYFTLFAIAALVCAGGLLFSKHPLNAAVYLVGVMLAISGLYALLGSPFLGVIQVLVYAGAIMMLVVFVIMVLNRARDHAVPLFDWWSLAAAVLPLLLLATVAGALGESRAAADPAAVRGDAEAISRGMFDLARGHGYWLLFEVIGVTLLVAIVGAVLLAKRRLDTPEAPAASEEAGHDAH